MHNHLGPKGTTGFGSHQICLCTIVHNVCAQVYTNISE